MAGWGDELSVIVWYQSIVLCVSRPCQTQMRCCTGGRASSTLRAFPEELQIPICRKRLSQRQRQKTVEPASDFAMTRPFLTKSRPRSCYMKALNYC